jgi:hypothetical protein
MTKRTLIIAIAVVILLLLAWLLFWPRPVPKPSPVPAGSLPPETNGVHVTGDVSTILKHEDEAVAKVLKNSKLDQYQKADAIDAIRNGDHEALKKLLSPADYDRLVQNLAWHDSEALGQK